MATWSQYRGTIGDRSGAFAAISAVRHVERALYPGCYVDLSPSAAIAAVTYVDLDSRAARFFADPGGVSAQLTGFTRPGAGTEVEFLAVDYTEPLPLPDAGYDLLISLFAPAVWDSCRRYLQPGGLLLANTSYGDASLAALDPNLRLVAIVLHQDGRYRLETDHLDTYLVAGDPRSADSEAIRRTRRGIDYTRPAWAYLFEAVAGVGR